MFTQHTATAAFTIWIASTMPLQAQQAKPNSAIHFNCPKAGTVELRRLGKVQYQGVSKDDVFVCIRLDYSERSVPLLFNYFGITNNKEDASMRSAMIDLLSFSKPSVSFTQISNNRFEHKETWTYLRREQLKIGDKTFDTLVLRQDDEQPNGNRLHQMVDHWLDPVNGLWLKQQFTYISGQVTGSPGSYEDVTVTLP